MTKSRLSLALASLLTAGPALAATVPVAATKLIIVDKTEAAGKAKSVFVSKDAGAAKGAATDLDTIAVRFDVTYDSTSGAFTLPAGASDGTGGWLVNKEKVAKYVNKAAPGGLGGAKVGIVKPGKLLKLVGPSLGDEPLDLFADEEPDGSVFTAYTVTNGSDVNAHCSEFPTCSFKAIAGGTGRKLVCKSGIPDPTCAARQGDTMSLATFNVGLAAGFVPLADERQPEIGAAIAASDYDVICLQEVFRDDDVAAIVSAASASYPYSYFELTDDPTAGGEPACTEEDVEDLLACVAANDCETDPDGLVTCALAHCGAEILALNASNPTCFNCVAANSGLPLDLLEQVCLEGGGSLRDNGRNGVVLLSKHPLVGTEFLTFDAFLVQRVLLHAQTFKPGTGLVDLFCTHFTADLSGVIAYGGPFDSYEDEQAAQVSGLLDWIDEVATSGRAIALGDFNTGPEILPDIEGEFPANYDTLVLGGLESPYADTPGAQCTYCEDNTLNGPWERAT
jgi:endonuclease/exonuclease/phosphatase family metal-dependent hydrolase